LLTPEGSDVQVVPSAAHLLIAPIVNEVCAKHAVAVADECVRAVPFIDAKVLVELVGQGVPRDELPAHPRLQALDVLLRRSRREHESGVARVQMRGVSDLVGNHGAAYACMFRPANHAGFEESAVDDQLTTTVEQLEQARLAVRSIELVL